MTRRLIALSALLVTLAWCSSAENEFSLDSLLDAAKNNPALAEPREKLVESARRAATASIVRRAKNLAEVGLPENRTWLDGRSNALEPEIREHFALAMSDFGACRVLSEELPLLAAGYRLTGDPALKDRVLAQLAEMAAWNPLQRPGWSLYHPGARLPEDGNDGHWLATGVGMRAIADALEILPPSAVDAPLRDTLKGLLEAEITGVVDDWHTGRQWFVRANDAITNQWVLPTEGLVRACLVLGPDTHRDAYELGVKNLFQALDAHGSAGEFEEGFGYASFTVTSLMNTARAMAAHGDRRALDRPFLKNFPIWFVHHLQPGGMVVNCFDAGGVHGATERMAPLLSLCAAYTGSPAARWALSRHTGGPDDSIAGLAARTLPPVGDDAAPPLFANYAHACRVNWRSAWDDDATGVWVRGGHPTDQHDHRDRGHVNFILHGQPIFIEAGTPYYHHPQMGSLFASGGGHNVLQLGTEEPPATVEAGTTLVLPGWQQAAIVAPIAVNRLDATGGKVALEITSGYDGLAAWKRTVEWDAGHLTVHDTVALQEGQKNTVLFRWHLGTNAPVTLRQDAPEKWTVTWNNASVTLRASAPIAVSQVKLPDNTINNVADNLPPAPLHTCLVVQSAAAEKGLELETVAGR